MMWIDTIKRWKWPLFAIIAMGSAIAVLQQWQSRREHAQDNYIVAAARKYNVDPALVKAVIWRESGFNPRVAGRAGEVGLMQIREAAASEWAKAERHASFNHRELFDPAKNTEAGTWYLRKLLGRYQHADDPLPYALADYNAGRTHVLRWNKGAAATNSASFIEQIDFPGTQAYVREVMKRYRRYRTERHDLQVAVH